MIKILLSVLTIGVVGVTAYTATSAFFSDTERSDNNQIVAGRLDLQISNKVLVNGQEDTSKSFTARNLASGTMIYNLSSLIPGDSGANSIGIVNPSNSTPMWACVGIGDLADNENGLADAETEMGDNTDTGELSGRLNFYAWSDNGDGIPASGETGLFTNVSGPASDVMGGKVYPIADSTIPGSAIATGATKYVGLYWCLGTITVAGDVPTCDGSLVPNNVMTDYITAKFKFYGEQSTNNDSFKCSDETGLAIFTP